MLLHWGQKLPILANCPRLVGQEVAVSDWLTVNQEKITCSRRPPATTSGSTWTRKGQGRPFGATIAHGFHAVADPQFVEIERPSRSTRMGVNYGLNRVRFTAPVPADSRIRARR